ncbi:hypothetical protein BV898_03451 [Hypsibius exemplaris]|uniref:Uncharacterized protein n=1 Tax=Hypsibius exemplaris TaxID=2072580 RepID=A0A1W0X533_HYPEX|nr:hypothetical protein BV898_03451 [Hypsibius exemplaris]
MASDLLLLDIPLPAEPPAHLTDLEPPPPPPPLTTTTVEKGRKSSSRNGTSGEENSSKRIKIAEVLAKKTSLLPMPPLMPPPAPVYAKEVFSVPKVMVVKKKDLAAEARHEAMKAFERDRKAFEAMVTEVFNSRKPHSAKNVLSVATLAVAQPTLYKVVEKVLSLMCDKMLREGNHAGFRTCIYLTDAIIGAAQKKFLDKEKYSARFQPMIAEKMARLMDVQVDGGATGAKDAEQLRRQSSELRKIKRECLRIVSNWLEKKRFQDSKDLKRHYRDWAAHFPELVALKSRNSHQRDKSHLPHDKSSSKSPPKTSSLLPRPGLGRGDPLPLSRSSAPTELMDRNNGNDLESRVQALMGAGRLAGIGIPLLRSMASPTPHLISGPQPSVGINRFTQALLKPETKSLLETPRLVSPIKQELPFPEYAAVQSTAGSAPAPRPRKFDPLFYLHRWKGFVPKPRPDHFTIVTCLLALKSLPKDALAEPDTLKATITRLFAHYGTVVNVTVTKKERLAVVQMDSRFQALKAKKGIIDPVHSQSSALPPIVHDDAEQVILQSIRSQQFEKIKLEWHPSAAIEQPPYRACWEVVPHGVAHIPHRFLHTDLLADLQCRSEMDLEKFARFAHAISDAKEAIILPESITQKKVIECYQKISQPLFDVRTNAAAATTSSPPKAPI